MKQKIYNPTRRKAIDLKNIHLRGNSRQRRRQRRQIERQFNVKLELLS